MPQVSERRRQPRRSTTHEGVWVKLENLPGSHGEVRARVVDASDVAIGIELPLALEENTYVLVHGHNGAGSNGKLRARVVRCIKLPNGTYSAGLTYETERSSKASGASAGTSEPIVDYYEMLQVNPKADPETIHRVFRMMAQRFHPDNGETGNAELFRSIVEAYKVLSDPEKRAAYDVNLHAGRQVRWRIFDQTEAAIGKRAEARKRRGVMELLYTARMNQPTHPVMSIHEIEDLLGCPREHLEFSLWYLKENALIVRSDNGRYSITAKGVDRVEQEEGGILSNDRLLTSAQPVGA